MKVMITGSTYSHMHGHMYFTKSPTVSQHLFDGLLLAGHQPVMCRAQDYVHNIDAISPDVILFGLTPAGSMSARQLHYEWEAIDHATTHGIRWCWFIDDWQFPLIPSSFRSMLNDYPRRVETAAKKNIRLGPMSWKLGMEPMVRKILSTFLNGDSAPVIMVYFDPEAPLEESAKKYTCGNLIFMVDPSGMFPKMDIQPTIPKLRERRWVLAALGNYQKWLGKAGPFTWPMKLFGPTGGKKDHVPERSIIQDWYATSWGMLVPSYPQKLGRLWRSRYIHGVMAGTITLTTDEAIHKVFGGSYMVKPSMIETSDDLGLDKLAASQANSFRWRTWSANHFASALDSLLGWL